MTLTVDLSESTLARLRAEAERRGVSIDIVIAELAETLPPEPAGEERVVGLKFNEWFQPFDPASHGAPHPISLD